MSEARIVSVWLIVLIGAILFVLGTVAFFKTSWRGYRIAGILLGVVGLALLGFCAWLFYRVSS